MHWDALRAAPKAYCLVVEKVEHWGGQRAVRWDGLRAGTRAALKAGTSGGSLAALSAAQTDKPTVESKAALLVASWDGRRAAERAVSRVLCLVGMSAACSAVQREHSWAALTAFQTADPMVWSLAER